MKKIILLTAFCTLSYQVYCQQPASKENVRTLLEITGSARIGTILMENMMNSFKQTLTAVPNEFWQDFAAELKPDTLINLLIPIYSKHYSNDEILTIIEFYKTPIGKKVIEKTPFITQESYAIGEEWGKKAAEQAIKKLIEKGYTKGD